MILLKGFNTRQADVRGLTQLIHISNCVAVIFQLQSLQQFGGVSPTHLDWTMVPLCEIIYKHFWYGKIY